MRRYFLSIPHEVKLKTREGWISQNEEQYFVYRNHWLVTETQLATRTSKTGEKVGLFGAPDSEGRIWEGSAEREWEHCSGEESVTQFLVEQEELATIDAKLLGELSPLAIGKVRAELKSGIQARVKQQVSNSTKAYRANTSRKTVTFSWRFPIPAKSVDRYCAASMYQMYQYDLSLVWTDFLFVTYDRPHLFSFKKVRLKYPELVGNRAFNWLEMRQPGWRLHAWNLFPNATTIWKENEFQQELDDPFALSVTPLEIGLSRTERPRHVPSLYSIANEAFPPKLGKWPTREEPDPLIGQGVSAG